MIDHKFRDLRGRTRSSLVYSNGTKKNMPFWIRLSRPLPIFQIPVYVITDSKRSKKRIAAWETEEELGFWI